MIDWSASMQQTYEFYEVDPSTWKDKKLITTVKTGTVNRDAEVETKGSATLDITESVGECYIRIYLISTQGDVTDKRPLGTFLAQTPSSSFDGKVRNVSMDAYTPLLELKEKHPPLGFFVSKQQDVMAKVYDLTHLNTRAPVITPITPSNKLANDFVAQPDDTWLDFISDLLTAAHTSTCYEVEQVDPVYEEKEITYCIVVDGEKTIYYTVKQDENKYIRDAKIDTNIFGKEEIQNVTTVDGDAVYKGKIVNPVYKYARTIRTVEVSDPASEEKAIDAKTVTKEQVYYGQLKRMTNVQYCVVDNNSIKTYYKVVPTTEGYVRGEVIPEPVSGVKVGGSEAVTTDKDDIYVGYMYETRDGYYCIVENNTRYTMTVDEMGRIYYAPEQEAASMQPSWTYTDDNSSILYPELTLDHDLYGIPNVVEVVYSDGTNVYYAKAINDDPNSPISTVGRGREIIHRMTNPDIYGTVTQEKIQAYADQMLEKLASVEYTVSYTHGFCPVKVGDCVRLNYERAGIKNIKAKVIRQSIKLQPGCPVTETAVFTTKLWG